MKNSIIILMLCCQATFLRYSSACAKATSCYEAKFYLGSRGGTGYKIGQIDTLARNTPAPEFSLTDFNGKQYSLKKLSGKIVVLNFWFIACKPCVNEIPVLNAVKNSFNPNQVVFLALALDRKDAVERFLKNNKFEYTILPYAKRIAEMYQVNAYPASIVIDNNGIIRFIQIGGPDIGRNLTAAIKTIQNSASIDISNKDH